MIGTGAITAINKTIGKNRNNAYEIELSILAQPGDTKEDLKNKRVLATASLPAGITNAYKVGDAVYIGFVNNSISQPVILGKIYKGASETVQGAFNASTLSVGSTVELPTDTKIGGVPFKQILELLTKARNKEEEAVESSQVIPGIGTVYCNSPVVNLRNYTNSDFSYLVELTSEAPREPKVCTICFDGDEQLSEENAKLYLRYMTGSDNLASISSAPDTYNGTLIIKSVYYRRGTQPCWQEDAKYYPEWDGRFLRLLNIDYMNESPEDTD